MVFTVRSASPFLLVRCIKPNLSEKSKNSFDVNCGPLSDITNSGIPFLKNTYLQLLAILPEVIFCKGDTSIHLE